MIIGVPKETKTDEYRVGLLAVGAELLTRDGHTVLVEKQAGVRSGFADEQYSAVGAQIVDVSIDQGGCIETCRPTTHHEPTYIVEDVVHYCVTNIPSAAGRASSQALCNATLPYVRELASLGVDAFAAVDEGHAAAVNLRGHRLVNEAVSGVYPDLPS
ncbi:MAG: hypothetical protein JSW59_17475 [Phycisphaerales bacterium]|nr:MAG: hypothetical protein JSW59_17475 [Phycisphaerales bacterium]